MRHTRHFFVIVFGAAAFVSAHQASVSTPQPGQSAIPATPAYEARCATCHGPAMTGVPRLADARSLQGSGPSILAYVRYHTDAEMTERLRAAHAGAASMQLSDEELKRVLADVRVLARTSPTMATGGYTGGRGGRGDAMAGGGAAPGGRAAGAGPGGGFGGGGRGRGGRGLSTGPVSVQLADGRSLTGRMMAQSEFDGTLLADGKLYLLARDGDIYREKAIEPKVDWVTYHGSLGAGRYSPLDQINLATVKSLSPAWVFQMPATSRTQATPVVADGLMYFTGWNEIYALDATTGRQLWTYSEPHTEGILGDAGGGSNRGAAIAGDRVLMVTDHAHLLAFNRFTGEKAWDVEMASYKDGYSATVPALVVGDLAIQGMSGGDEGVRGFLDAYRVSTGERVWRFWTIPKRGEKRSETWGGQAIDHGCGATWQTGSYDPTLDLTYWGTGNPCPAHNGEERQGDNLYTAGVIAVSVKTGELKWFYQFTPHDTNDWDAAQPMILVDEMWQGRPRQLLLHGNRNGMYYVLDRATGEFLLGTNLSTKITWNHGFTKEGRPIVDPSATATREGIALCPGPNGGTNWPDSSYSPKTKLFYARVADSCGISTVSDDPLTNGRWFGEVKPDPEKAQQKLAALMADYAGGNFIRAVDALTGKKVWDYAVAGGRTGPLSTGGGLVFLGASGGMVALDAKTGKPVWNINLAQNSQSTPMTYMVGGKQYIALPGTNSVVAYALR